MEKKAQGAIEYLLIIGAAILVVAIVIIAITSVMNQGKSATDQGTDAAVKAANTTQCIQDVTALGNGLNKTGCVAGVSKAVAKTDCQCCVGTDITATKQVDITKTTSVCSGS